MKPLPIRLRLTLWYALVLALALLFFGLFLHLTTTRALYTQVDASLKVLAGQAAAALQDENGLPALRSSDEPTPPLPALLATRGYAVRLITGSGQVLDSAGECHLLPAIPPEPGFTTCSAGGELWRLYTITLPPPANHDDLPEDAATRKINFAKAVQYPNPAAAASSASPGADTGGNTYLQVAQSLAGVQGAERRMRTLLGAGIAAALALAGAGGAFLADRALRPIERITQGARRIGAQDLGQRLNLNLPDDEVGRLARTFDEMLARLEEAFLRERQFTSDAAHELRTPLTVLKGTIGVALHRPRTAAQYREVLHSLEAEVDRLIDLCEDLLALARSENAAPGDLGPVSDLGQAAALAVERLRPFATARGVALELEIEAPLPVRGSPEQLGRAIYNLVHNAIKYTPSGGHVRVTGRIVPGELPHAAGRGSLPSRTPAPPHMVAAAEVQVTDDGPGISPEDLPRIFAPFFRTDRARTRTTGSQPGSAGAGLGLTIARAIARAHGGDITAASTPGQGSTFVLSLPLAHQT
jgi:signal transduction histidine kinase